MPKNMIIAIVIVVAIVITGYFLTIRNSQKELTPEQLNEFVLQVKRLNVARDFSLVKDGISYRKDIGKYNGRAIQLAFQCWGDLCPGNGSFFITYKDVSKDDCSKIGGFIVEGNSGWGSLTYGGCSPTEPDQS